MAELFLDREFPSFDRDQFFFLQVSDVIPTYNRVELLIRSIGSVVNQSFEALEILVVDDHSTDHTLEVDSAWKERDHRVRYFKNEGNDVSAARNTGTERARGEHMLYLDDDDE